MRGISRIFPMMFTLLLVAGAAEAQSMAPADREKWDFGTSVGMFEVSPGDNQRAYGDDWYLEGRYAASIGRYWTRNLKTEIEFATSGEGSQFRDGYARVPGTNAIQPFAYQYFHRIQQTTGRVVYQFFDNTWVHPWLSAGVVYEMDHQRFDVPPGFLYSSYDPRVPQPVPVDPKSTSGRSTDHRAGGSIGAGTKVYLSPNSYLNSGIVASFTKPSATWTVLLGFGIDF